MRIMSVVGARPNFMKIAPLCHAIEAHNREAAEPVEHTLVHTGQHYDVRMSQDFFRSLNIPDPDINLEIGSGTHAEQVGKTMIAFEKVVRDWKPDWVVVFGDVNATCACSITAKKEHVKLAHVEAGLRSFDMDMPEEVNRLVTDRLSDLLFTPDEISSENLRREGVPEERIHMVGNIMIDTLEANRAKAQALSLEAVVGENTLPGVANDGWHMQDDGFTVVTLHRPSNVDDPAVLGAITAFLCDEVASKLPLVWPVHPRTQDRLKSAGLWEALVAHDDVVLLAPVGYHSMLRLTMGARVMLTDSGGLQEECCVLGTPCLTMRWNTERPVTLAEHGGASVLVGNDVGSLREAFGTAYAAERSPQRPELWDGHTASRVLRSLLA